ncbi:MAG: peroxiredoxin [Halobacteria archaeon]
MVNVGDPAPDFTLFDADRKPRKLSEFLGKNVLLAFYPGAFTGVCTKEMCTFRDSLERLKGASAEVVGVSVDPPFANKAWADQHKLPFTLLSDYERNVVNRYGVAFPNLAGLPRYVAANRAVFIVDRSGVVRYKWVAPNPGVEPNYPEVQKVLAGLK